MSYAQLPLCELGSIGDRHYYCHTSDATTIRNSGGMKTDPSWPVGLLWWCVPFVLMVEIIRAVVSNTLTISTISSKES